jgi:uncharacterized membrane protein
MAVTVTHLYDDYASAAAAVRDLEAAGLGRDQISVVAQRDNRAEQETSSGAATGATAGGVAGAGVGLLTALGLIAIPGIGPLVAAGVLATTLAGAATGVVTGGLLGALVDYGIPEKEAHVYAESIRRGGTLVSVRASENQSDRVESIMRTHNPADIDERGRLYRNEGWTGYDPANPETGSQSTLERDRQRAPR